MYIATCAIPALANSCGVPASTAVGAGVNLETLPRRALPLSPMLPLGTIYRRLEPPMLSSPRHIAYTVFHVPRPSRGLPGLISLGGTTTLGSSPHVQKPSMPIVPL